MMEYSGHKSYQSFSVYLHKTDLGEKRACLILESVDGFLTALGPERALKATGGQSAASAHPLQNHKNEDQSRSVA